MLNSVTKRKIDNMRDILSEKIPLASKQIELITIALIYKSIGDIDTHNKKIGSAGFFIGDFEKYSRSNIMDNKINVKDRLPMYSEGLDKMGTNKNIPQMFRDIFHNTSIQLKDPEILNKFLKEVDGFSSENSEEFGDAFEYLLFTSGNKGDDGQFFTPRHIIDLIIKAVEPSHSDTILDPACGTAGFLINSYNYILQQNMDKKPGDKLTILQKTKLANNFIGYDISHEMVILSLVNLYFHKIGNPKVYEYNTLSNEDKRNDKFDCILTNPPFITPKGGLNSHSRFSITANKAEILFLDYIMDHLKANGKAGIIVPEEIIFESGKEYSSLRKKMIEKNYLRGIISLPIGVFNPHTGIKTSILLFDKKLAKKAKDIFFIEVKQDGFSLGTKRTETPNKNDLPKVLKEILIYKKSLNNNSEFKKGTNTVLIPKSDIIKNKDHNLTIK